MKGLYSTNITSKFGIIAMRCSRVITKTRSHNISYSWTAWKTDVVHQIFKNSEIIFSWPCSILIKNEIHGISFSWKTIHKKLLYWRIHLLPVWKGLIKKKEGMLSAESRSNKDKDLDKKSTSNRSVYIYIYIYIYIYCNFPCANDSLKIGQTLQTRYLAF